MEAVNNILLVRIPAQEAVGGRILRDYILESLRLGVLVLMDGVECEVLELPPLGGVELAELPSAPLESGIPAETPEEPEADGPAEEPPLKFTGRNREEKQAILERLRAYRRVHGLGCWPAVAREAGREVSTDLLRDMMLGEASPPIAVWLEIDRALDRMEQKTEGIESRGTKA